jgi:hypothetical protein
MRGGPDLTPDASENLGRERLSSTYTKYLSLRLADASQVFAVSGTKSKLDAGREGS